MVDINKQAFWHFTFKDILTILCSATIPIALAIYTAIGSQQQKREAEKTRQFDLEQSRELRQQTLYDEFINNIFKLDNYGYLKERKNPWAFANAYYRAAHRQWDTIHFDNVHLASQTGTLHQLNLQCVSFDQVSMSNAVFSFASLNGVSFDGARLGNVKFDGSSLLCTSFNGTNLTGAHFSNSDMTGAKITEDQIKHAYFYNVIMPNGKKSEITSSTTTKKPITQTTTTTTIIKTKMSTTSLPSSTSTISTTSSTTTTTSSTTSTSTTTLTATSTLTTTTSTTTTSTTTTLTTTSTTTTAGNPCLTGNYLWNTSGITILDSSQVTNVVDIYIDSQNTLYITDEAPSAVAWRLLKNATSATVIAGTKGSTGSSNTQLRLPQSVYVDNNGTMYVVDYANQRIQKYINGSNSGITIAGLSESSGSSLNQLDHPRFITLDPTQTYIYIADNDNHRIMRYSTNSISGDNGTVVAGGTGQGNTNTSLNKPWGLWYQPPISSDLFITNHDGHSIMRWTPGASSGTFIAGVPGTVGSNSTLLNNPMGIKLDKYLNMFVVDYSNHRIQMFCANNEIGITIVGTGNTDSTATALNGPRGIAFDSDMNMYVADLNNKRVQKFLKL
ncbi:unnamed protein product [Adineta steineri]|uniref:NHL repeat containing protein n=2 Tax=Adineta steineri TaxID=433720 RepID=A0A813MJE7_9BILA|nr:unnamed protein product [Adineta steineri]CAF4083639.1 unnamed protein product [Adineta steineri]CAF4102220.1 unnamed protein product [Adineta steineri]